MARKQKRLSRKEQKKQRQTMAARVRQERGWKPRQAIATPGQNDLLDDMLPLFPRIEDGPATPAMMQEMMMTIMESTDLIEEPEFEELILDPVRCVEAFIESGQELGIEPDELGELPEEELEDQQLDMLEMTTRRLLTPEVRRDIVERLDQLRLRLRRSAGNRQKVARVAALQSILSGAGKDVEEIWPAIGLVQALIQRGIEAGFTLFELTEEATREADLEEIEDAPSLFERLSQSNVVRKTEGILKKIPGLGKFLEKQTDKIWDEGLDAIFEGELHLELYTEDELVRAMEIMRPYVPTVEAARSEKSEAFIERGKSLIFEIDAYVTWLFTPERLEQLRKQLNKLLKERDFPEKYTAFVMMVAQRMADEEALEYEKPFLVKCLIGEIRAQVTVMETLEQQPEAE
jgi:hypothetical protein